MLYWKLKKIGNEWKIIIPYAMPDINLSVFAAWETVDNWDFIGQDLDLTKKQFFHIENNTKIEED